MNVASLDLCKELYELSGWGNPDSEESDDMLTWCANEGQELTPWNSTARSEFSFSGFVDTEIPAYDLGYLLLKLPNEATSKKHGGYHYLYLHHGKLDWYAYYGEIDTTEFMSAADTPEGAACKLCCELIRQGVLKP